MNYLEKFITIKKDSKIKNIYNVDLINSDNLQNYDSFEIHCILYPYSREINSDHIKFNPYEEYVQDVASNQISAYEIIEKTFARYFGIILGALICIIFLIFKPEDLFSVESVVGIFAAYSIGKELWNDLENFLYKFTKNSKIRYQESYFKYKVNDRSTLTLYSDLAKKIRYGKASIMPESMHFFQLSNSQTLRMKFVEIEKLKKMEERLHLFSIKIDSSKIKEFESNGFLFGLKISLIKNRVIGKISQDFFQSMHNFSVGCLDQMKWSENKIYYRKSYFINKIRIFKGEKILESLPLFEWLNSKSK